jgi:tRNA A-37 threonylcarbamoyl transferase component Bud32
LDLPDVCPACGSRLVPGAELPICLVCGHLVGAAVTGTELPIDAAPTVAVGVHDRAAESRLPERIGDCTVLGLIGRGGTASVYLAFQESMRRKVALKVLDLGAIQWERRLERFEREAWIAGRLSHPNIVRVHEQGLDGSRWFIVMELVEGRSLGAYLDEVRESRNRSWLSDSEWRIGHVRHMVELFAGVADALAYVHGQGVIHRDIKPLNLLLTKDDRRLMVTDFGLARDLDASRVTQRGDFMGTIRYMSPEQLLAQRVDIDHRTDLWSFGVSLYEAVTLTLPYDADTEEGYIGQVATKEPVPVRRRGAAIPVDLETILMKCLERDPEARYASAAALRDDLRRYLEDRPVTARRASAAARAVRLVKRRRKPIAAALAASVVAAVLTYVVISMFSAAETRRRLDFVLERVAADGVEPGQIEPTWSTLADVLRAGVLEAPAGTLANKAREATLRVVARISAPVAARQRSGLVDGDLPVAVPFGLLSIPPVVSVVVTTLFDIGVPIYATVRLEASVDGGDWTSVGSSTVFIASTPFLRLASRGVSGDCDFPLPPSAAAVGPHRIAFRATVAYTPPPDMGRVSFSRSCSPPTPAPPAENRAVLHQAVKTLESATVSLYEQYPAGVPAQVDPYSLAAPVETWFGPERLDVIQVRAPRVRTGSTVEVSDFRWNVWLRGTCLPAGVDYAGSIVGLDFVGTFRVPTPIPIAGTAEWHPPGDAEAHLSFPVVSGPAGLRFEDGVATIRVRPNGLVVPHAVASAVEPRIVPLAERPAGSAVGGFTSKAIEFREPIWLRALLVEGSVAGVLEVRPSRERALGNYLERYLGAFSRPVTLGVRTIEGKWVQNPDCAPASEGRATEARP